MNLIFELQGKTNKEYYWYTFQFKLMWITLFRKKKKNNFISRGSIFLQLNFICSIS